MCPHHQLRGLQLALEVDRTTQSCNYYSCTCFVLPTLNTSRELQFEYFLVCGENIERATAQLISGPTEQRSRQTLQKRGLCHSVLFCFSCVCVSCFAIYITLQFFFLLLFFFAVFVAVVTLLILNLSRANAGVANAFNNPRLVPRKPSAEPKQPCACPLFQPPQGKVEPAQGRLPNHNKRNNRVTCSSCSRCY